MQAGFCQVAQLSIYFSPPVRIVAGNLFYFILFYFPLPTTYPTNFYFINLLRVSSLFLLLLRTRRLLGVIKISPFCFNFFFFQNCGSPKIQAPLTVRRKCFFFSSACKLAAVTTLWQRGTGADAQGVPYLLRSGSFFFFTTCYSTSKSSSDARAILLNKEKKGFYKLLRYF